ncbi:ester cyclase [Octadecabacter sp. CECT 8868]|uniref:ester cyclase n=1 Tax=Octadecabacter algicola TaxID=2909342 RepID=UPI001F306921|nr:ester cyclase [Octadecabacter algicola]MCF2904973.1 ester cyclase [Octadecabacter algicola]
MTFKAFIASATLATLASGAFADDTATVTTFYDLLSNPGSQDLVAEFQDATSEDWISVGDYSGNDKTRDAFLGQMGGFAQLMPDLNWEIQDMHQDGNTVIVRSRATGTPVAPFFGVDGEGRSFDILTIDIHELEDGLIARTYHVEDWAGALQQLAGN